MESLTAKMCMFCKLFHMKNSNIKVYNEKYLERVMDQKEYNTIFNYLDNGIKFFDSNYTGNDRVLYIVNKFIGATILGRSAYLNRVINNEIKLGLKEYVVLGSGYDMSMYEFKNIKVFELDKKDTIIDKKRIVRNANIDNNFVSYVSCDLNSNWLPKLYKVGYDKNIKSLFSLMGVSYYLNKDIFINLIKLIGENISSGSVIVFDYPICDNKVINDLALGASENIISTYDIKEFEIEFQSVDLLIYEDIGNDRIDELFFSKYNILNPNFKINSPKNVRYIMLVKK